MIFFSSDHHFGHKNIIQYANRPFSSVDEMDGALIQNWNKKVMNDDVVFYLGDFHFYNPKAYLSILNGKIIFIRGNHDKSGLTTITSLTIKIDGHHYFLTHRPEDCNLLTVTICGHVHSLWKHTINQAGFPIVNVGVDIWNYSPVSFDELKTYLMEIGYRNGIKVREAK